MLRHVPHLAWGFVLLFASVVLAENGALGELYGRGVHAYNSGNFVEAYNLLTRAIESGSEDPRCHYFRGLSYIRLGREPEARQDFTTAAAMEMEDTDRFYNVSKSLERIQGRARTLLERYRSNARLRAFQSREEERFNRYQRIRRNEPNVTIQPSATEEVPAGEPSADAESPAEEMPAEEMPAEEPGPNGDVPAGEMPADEPMPEAEDPFSEDAAPAEDMPADEPAADANKPAADTDEPKTDDDPFADDAKPEEDMPADEPAADGDKPKTEEDDPFADDAKPEEEMPADEPAADGNKPAADGDKPAADGDKPKTDENDPFADDADRKSTRLNSSHAVVSRMPSSA